MKTVLYYLFCYPIIDSATILSLVSDSVADDVIYLLAVADDIWIGYYYYEKVLLLEFDKCPN